MQTKYYSNLYVIEDPKRVEKLLDLFVLSVKNDLSKWKQVLSTRTNKNSNDIDLIQYISPKYNNDSFIVEYASTNNYTVYGVVYLDEKTPQITGTGLQIFADWDRYGMPPKKIRAELDKLRDNIFEQGIINLENAIGGKSAKSERKDKLMQLNIETYKGMLDDSFNDFIKEPTQMLAKMIARTAYAFNLNHHLPYSEWVEKFKDYSMVIKEIEKLDNYET